MPDYVRRVLVLLELLFLLFGLRSMALKREISHLLGSRIKPAQFLLRSCLVAHSFDRSVTDFFARSHVGIHCSAHWCDSGQPASQVAVVVHAVQESDVLPVLLFWRHLFLTLEGRDIVHLHFKSSLVALGHRRDPR